LEKRRRRRRRRRRREDHPARVHRDTQRRSWKGGGDEGGRQASQEVNQIVELRIEGLKNESEGPSTYTQDDFCVNFIFL
jgi:hypothetical protein